MKSVIASNHIVYLIANQTQRHKARCILRLSAGFLPHSNEYANHSLRFRRFTINAFTDPMINL